MRQRLTHKSLTAKAAEDAKEKKRFTAKHAKDAKERESLTAKNAKAARKTIIRTRPQGRQDNAKGRIRDAF